MIASDDRIPVHDIVKATIQTTLFIPFYSYYVNAGFASPAESYIEKACDLNELCIDNEEATYFVRVGSDSMSGDRIERGDVLIVDCSKEPSDGKIVVVWYNGDHAVKRIYHVEKMVVLLSSNPKYDPIYVHEGEDFSVFGVVIHVFFKPVVRPSLHGKNLIKDAITTLGKKNNEKNLQLSKETHSNHLNVMAKQRRVRKDIQVGNLEKKKDFAPGTIRNTDGSDSRSDKELGNLRDEYGEQAMKDMLTGPPKED